MANSSESFTPEQIAAQEEKDKKRQRLVEAGLVGAAAQVAGAPVIPVAGAVGAGVLLHRGARNKAEQIRANRHEIEDTVRERMREAGLLDERLEPKKVNAYYWKGMGRMVGKVIRVEALQQAGANFSREFIAEADGNVTGTKLAEIYRAAASMSPVEAAEFTEMVMNGEHLDGDIPEQAAAQAVAATEVRLNRLTTDMEIQQQVADALAEARVDAWRTSSQEQQDFQQGRFVAEQIARGMLINPLTLEQQRVLDVYTSREGELAERDSYEFVQKEAVHVDKLFGTPTADLDANERRELQYYLDLADKEVPKSWKMKYRLAPNREVEARQLLVAEVGKQIAMQERLEGTVDGRAAEYLETNPDSIYLQSANVDRLIGQYNAEIAQINANGGGAAEIAEARQRFLEQLNQSGEIQTYLDSSLENAEEEMKKMEEKYFEQVHAIRGQGAGVSAEERRAAAQSMGPEFVVAMESQEVVQNSLDALSNGQTDEIANDLRGQLTALGNRLATLQADADLYEDVSVRVVGGGRGRNQGGREQRIPDSKILKDHPNLREYIDVKNRIYELSRIENELQDGNVTEVAAHFRRIEEDNNEIIVLHQEQYLAELAKLEARRSPISSGEIAQQIGADYENAYLQLEHSRRLKEMIPVWLEQGDVDQWFEVQGVYEPGLGTVMDVLALKVRADVNNSAYKVGEFRYKERQLRDREDAIALKYLQEVRQRREDLVAGKVELREVNIQWEEMGTELHGAISDRCTDAEKQLLVAQKAHADQKKKQREMRSELLDLRDLVQSGRETLQDIYGDDVFDKMRLAQADIQRAAAEDARMARVMQAVESGEGVSAEEAGALKAYLEQKRSEQKEQGKTLQSNAESERVQFANDMIKQFGLEDNFSPDQVNEMVQDTEGMSFFAFLFQLINTMFSQQSR